MKISKLLKNHDGAAAVEFAIVVPVLLLLALGSFEFGLLFYNKQVITNACREGARAGIVRDGSYFLEDSDLKAIVKNYCEENLMDFGNTSLTDDDIELDPSPKSARNSAAFGSDFSVKTTYNHKLAAHSFFAFFGLGLEPTIAITSLALMKMEQMP